MSDSDEEIFWGPVTVRELKIISHQLFPADGQENIGTELESDLESSCELNMKEKQKNDIFSEDWTQLKNVHSGGDGKTKKTANSEFHLVLPDVTSSKVTGTVPEIVISDFSHQDQNDPCNTITSTIIEHDITDRGTDDGYGSTFVDSFIQENDSFSKGSDIPLQSSQAHQSVKSSSNSEIYLPVGSENIVSSPKEKQSYLKGETFQHARSDSNEVSIGHDSSIVRESSGSFDNSMKCNISYRHNCTNTSLIHDDNEDDSKSTHANISSSPFLTTNCSADTHLSKSISSSSNDLHSQSFQFTMVSLNSSETVCERSSENCQDLASFSNCEAFSNSHESVLSNLISEIDNQSATKKSNSDSTTCLSEEIRELSIKDNIMRPMFKNSINNESSNVDTHSGQVTMKSENFNVTPIKNIMCSSKIPVLQKTPSSASGSLKNRGDSVKSDSNKCENDYPYDFSNSQPFYIPELPVSYDINTDNLVTRSPNGNIVPTACSGSSVQTSTSISGNYVHVMTSEKISELDRNGFFVKSSPSTQDVPASSRKQNSEFEDSDISDIEAENGSVLCSSSLTSNSSANNSLNGTLEEMEMMMKHGYDYMYSKNGVCLNPDQEGESQSNAMPVSVTKPGLEQKHLQRGLKQCQYIRSSCEEMKPPFQKEFKDIYGDAVRTPKFKSRIQKPASAVCPRQLQRLKKTINFSNIRSPVGAYIKDRPVQLLKTFGKVKPLGREDVPSRIYDKECNGSSAKQVPLKNAPALPEIVYEKVPGINVNAAKATERCGSSRKNYAMPTVIKHAGRAVLATVPQNALQIIKNTEVSVLYDKDVSKTATL